tara:strand:- start:13004 stop:13705 length:702 start_codon:yes stop_codon:yes gene_type:complete
MNNPSTGAAEPVADRGWNDCWNSIGIHGDVSCPKLEDLAHCRNCPTYSAAASAFLDRDLPTDYKSEWTTHFSQSKIEESLKTVSVAIFRIGVEWFALSTLVLEEVDERRKMHSVPHRRNGAIAGLVNIRGELLVCLSPQKILGIEPSPQVSAAPGERNHERLLVIKHEGKRAVFPVDEVAGTYRYHENDFSVPPATVTMAANSFTRTVLRWRGKVIGCLDGRMLMATLNSGVT